MNPIANVFWGYREVPSYLTPPDSGKRRFSLESYVNLVFQTDPKKSHFFGYYDKSPLNQTAKRLLSHRVDFDGQNIRANDRAEVGFFNLLNDEWHPVGQTTAFNWQQGAMLQWLGPDYQSRFIYNDQSGDHFISVIVDIDSGEKRTIPFPVYAVHPSSKSAIAVNFERHYYCRAYHYEGIRNEKWNCLLHPEDGLFKIDLDSGSSKLIIKTEDIAHINPLPQMAGASHWLEHVMWNPSGSRFIFLHRFGHGEYFKTRLYSADAVGKNLFPFPDMAVISHMGWRNDTDFVVWAMPESTLRAAYRHAINRGGMASAALASTYRWARNYLLPTKGAKKLSRGMAAYMLMRDGSTEPKPLGFDVLVEDGHPTWTRDGRYMLTDTYEDEFNMRKLMLFDAELGELKELGKFYSPYNRCGYRCDLHPRFDHQEEKVVIDTAHSGRRKMLVLDISSLLKKNQSSK